MKSSIKNLQLNLRPRERLKKYGVNSLGDDELLAILIATGSKELSCKELAVEIINKVEKINNLENITIEELTSINGIGEAKAITIIAALELGKRVLKKDEQKVKIDNSKIVYDLFKYDFINCYQEKFIALFLDNKKNLIKAKTIFVGTLSSSTVHPREIFKLAIKLSASAIIVIHNHPSGNSNPSEADISLTKRLIEIGNLMGIIVLDHIIIGYKNYYSYLDNKRIDIDD